MIEELIRYIELDLPDKRMFRIPEVAKYFNVNDRTIRTWMKDKRIKYEKIGGSIRISRQAILELAYDPREANYLIQNVSDWLGTQFVDGKEVSRCVEISQGPALMSEPMKEVEARIYSRSLLHSNDPVFTWMMGNVVLKQGRNSGPVKYYICIVTGKQIGRAHV